MPALRDWHAVDESRLRATDARVLDGVNRALRELGAAPIAAAAELFESELELLCTFDRVDPFGPREAEYLGPLDDSASGLALEWRGPGPRVLAYLKPRYPRFPDLVRALATLPGESIVAAPGLLEAHAAQLSSERVRVIAGTVSLAGLLASADLCLGHGGAGFTGRALAAGVPQGMLVMHLEQFLVARRVETAGAGATVIPEKPVADLAAWVRDLAASASLREGARRAAATLPALDARANAERAAARVASLMAR
jgi:UDP:flavonoid glycosyltransferase YjiC (YdhE family)